MNKKHNMFKFRLIKVVLTIVFFILINLSMLFYTSYKNPPSSGFPVTFFKIEKSNRGIDPGFHPPSRYFSFSILLFDLAITYILACLFLYFYKKNKILTIVIFIIFLLWLLLSNCGGIKSNSVYKCRCFGFVGPDIFKIDIFSSNYFYRCYGVKYGSTGLVKRYKLIGHEVIDSYMASNKKIELGINPVYIIDFDKEELETVYGLPYILKSDYKEVKKVPINVSCNSNNIKLEYKKEIIFDSPNVLEEVIDVSFKNTISTSIFICTIEAENYDKKDFTLRIDYR